MATTAQRLSPPLSLDKLSPTAMLVCVTCGSPVPHLWREVSPGNIRLTNCSHCGAVADPYIEYETILVLLDLAGQRKEAYRHLLYNTQSNITRQLPPSLLLTGLVTAQLLVLALVARLSLASFTAPL